MFSLFNKTEPTPQITFLPPEEMGKGAKKDRILKIVTAVALSALALGLTIFCYSYLTSFTHKTIQSRVYSLSGPTLTAFLIPLPFLPFDFHDYSSKANVCKFFERMKIEHNFPLKGLDIQKIS